MSTLTLISNTFDPVDNELIQSLTTKTVIEYKVKSQEELEQQYVQSMPSTLSLWNT